MKTVLKLTVMNQHTIYSLENAESSINKTKSF